MSNYVIPVFPAASRVPPRDALAARLAELTGRFAELSSELAAISSAVASVSGKADKAPPAAPGSLASLDASGNLLDSGATPASIKAAAVAEVVANAPGTMDTLKEIADILGSAQQSGTVLKRISDLETGKVDEVPGKGLSANDYTDEDKAKLDGLSPRAQADWSQTDTTAPDFVKNKPTLAAVATSGSYDDLSGKPAIPAPGAVDATLSTQGAAADAKAVGDALRSEFTEWVFSGDGYDAGHTYTVVIDPSEEEGYYDYMLYDNGTYVDLVTVSTDSDLVVYFSTGITATRHFATPTKTSQLENDGDGTNAFVKDNDSRLANARAPTAHVHAVSDVTGLGAAIAGKADKVAGATAGNLAALDAQGNLADSGVKASDFAKVSDLPYRLVEPGKWEITPSTYSGEPLTLEWRVVVDDEYAWILSGVYGSEILGYDENSLALEGTYLGEVAVTATRSSLPGHLADRAGNRVVVSGDTTLTLPAAVPGYLRDFLVRLEISGSTVPTITFVAPTGETITYETDGDDFPVPDDAGDWLYSFTESCVAHKFAVALKKVNVVAQGGS